MSVTIHPSSRTPEPARLSGYTHATSAEQLLASITTDDDVDGNPRTRLRPHKELIQSSFPTLSRTTSTTYAAKNGLIFSCLEAYNNHHNLVLRPDDVWLAILTQLSIYINANASTLRSLLLHSPPTGAQTDKKELHIETPLSPSTDHGAIAGQMAALLAGELADPALLEDFVLPSFSTTLAADTAAACVALLGTMHKYFVYSWGTRCGIPAVRLLGAPGDWAALSARCASYLGAGRLGAGAERWYREALRPVLDGFEESFRDPRGERARLFWRGVVDREEPNGSGKVAYSGWVTAFAWWDEEGACLRDAHPAGLERGQVPMGFVKVPVRLVEDGFGRQAEMVAGSVGMRVRRWEEGKEGEEGDGGYARGLDGYDTIQPESGWFIYFV
ncbi:hypothetical protein MFIFM68171_10354 [Madurella fahalii]|uniref:Uncharacterized protein n=1 Tax=Madurella fahalii TaxID=1157608 RepID=A0ABQ0GQX8_9PEZI